VSRSTAPAISSVLVSGPFSALGCACGVAIIGRLCVWKTPEPEPLRRLC